MHPSKAHRMIGEGFNEIEPNSTNDRYELGRQDNEKRKERLPEFCLFRSVREWYPPPVRATTARVLAKRHGASCSLPATALKRMRARRWLSSAKCIGRRFSLTCASGDSIGMRHRI